MANFNDKDSNQQASPILIGILFIVGAVYYFSGAYEENQKYELNERMNEIHAKAAQNLNEIQVKVANDAVDQYILAKRNGNAMDAYIQAGIVAASYLQVKDEANYIKWIEIRDKEARAAGLKRD